MLIIVSDLHLTDGTSGSTVHQGAFRLFQERLRALAYAASWRAGGKYKPIEKCHVVLLGDILDVLRSSEWLKPSLDTTVLVRPWDSHESQPFISKIRTITERILSRNAVVFDMMRELHGAAVISVPPATHEGSPLQSPDARERVERVRVNVRIHYMVGNHDWFYHLSHPAYSGIRRTIVETLGLDNDPCQPFPHDPEEPGASSVLEAFSQHRVFARHGDIFDPVNFEGDRDRSSLGDSIVIDLVTRFAVEVKARLGDSLSPECLAGLNDIDKVRPLLLAPVWAGGILRRTCHDSKLRRKVQEAWNDVAEQWMKTPFVWERLSSRRHFRAGRRVQLALILSKRLMIADSSRWTCWLAERFGSGRKSYFPHAFEERWFRQHRAQFIVYGHTHHHEVVALNSVVTGDGPFDQMYINSGTWRPIQELAKYRPGHEAFVGYNTMTYLAFFKDDERGGRNFECWTGGLSGSA